MNWEKPCRYCGCKLILDKNIYPSRVKQGMHICKDCSKKQLQKYKDTQHYSKKYNIKMKHILATLKINGCAICGYNKCNASLDFHHVNPDDKWFCINTSYIKGHKDIDVANELNKCILLCCNCHRQIHSG